MAPEDGFAALLRIHLPTAERIGINTVTYSSETTTVQFEAKLKGGGWITGEWQR